MIHYHNDPVLLVFLIATLTMKMWSEEKRVGTVEFLLTLPVKISDIVLKDPKIKLIAY